MRATKRFSCPQCNMTFSHKQNLVRHSSVHSGEKPFICKFCGKGFPTATNQRRHERIHEGVKPYTCSHCNSHFSQSGDLKKHIRKLHSEFFHPCDICLKYFSTIEELGEHFASHGKTLEINDKVVKKEGSQINLAPAISNSKTNTPNNGAMYCSWCKKKFSTKVIFNRHKKVCPARPQAKESDENDDDDTGEIVGVPSMKGGYKSSKFYAHVSENIANNLQNHLDGKVIKVSTKVQQKKTDDYVTDDTDWRKYNFPPEFTGVTVADDDDGAPVVEQENDKSKVRDDVDWENNFDNQLTNNDEQLVSADEDHVFDLSSNRCRDSNSTTTKCDANSLNDKLSSVMIYICHACGENFHSLYDIDNHKLNNHPNVDCTHLEIESSRGAPAEMFQFHCSPVGFLQNCPVLTYIEESKMTLQLRCTKCQMSFAGTIELHEHILDCGSLNKEENDKRKRQHVPKFFKRGIKRDSSIEAPTRFKRYCTRVYKETIGSTFDMAQNDEYHCQLCNARFKNISAMERHKKLCSKSGTPVRTSPPRSYKCDMCKKEFPCAASLKKHTMDSCSSSEKKQNVNRNLRKTRYTLKKKRVMVRHQVSVLKPKLAPIIESEVDSQEITKDNPCNSAEGAEEDHNDAKKEENQEIETVPPVVEILNELENNVPADEEEEEEEAPFPAPANDDKEISDETVLSSVATSVILTCKTCKKVFSSYVVMLKHILSHKLEITQSNGLIESNDGVNNDTENELAAEVKEEEEEEKPKVAVSRTRNRNGGRKRKRRNATVSVAKRLKEEKRVIAV
ncbi:hypothetical protein CHUAL_010679 [Chamberlinius hualienensis]